MRDGRPCTRHPLLQKQRPMPHFPPWFPVTLPKRPQGACLLWVRWRTEGSICHIAQPQSIYCWDKLPPQKGLPILPCHLENLKYFPKRSSCLPSSFPVLRGRIQPTWSECFLGFRPWSNRLHAIIHVILEVIIWVRYYHHAHLTDDNIETQRG